MRIGSVIGVLAAVVVAGWSASAAPGGIAPDDADPVTTASAAAAPDGRPARSGSFVLVADSPAATATARVAAGDRVAIGLRVANASDAPQAVALVARAPWLEVPRTIMVPARRSIAVTAVASPSAGVPAGVLRGVVAARGGGDASAALSVAYESAVPVVVHVTAAAR